MKLDNDMMIAFLWDQVKRLSERVRQHDGEVQKGYSDMCKLENKGLIPHLAVEEPEEVLNETEVMDVPVPLEEEPIPEPPEPEPEPDIEEVVDEVVEDTIAEIVDPEPHPIEADNVDDLLEQYRQKLEKKE